MLEGAALEGALVDRGRLFARADGRRSVYGHPQNPERAHQLGLVGEKAQLTAGGADWPTSLGMLAQSVAVGGGMLFAFLTSWIVGREFEPHRRAYLVGSSHATLGVCRCETGGDWTPWAVPALVAGATGPDGEAATRIRLLIVPITALLGVAATLTW